MARLCALLIAAASALLRAPSVPRIAHVPRVSTALKAQPVDIVASDTWRWYILQCYVGNEIWCAATIAEVLGMEKNAAAAERCGRFIAPTEKVASTRGRKVYRKDRIVYPGYVFCELKLDQPVWDVLTRIPKVANFVGMDHGMRNGIGDVIVGYKGAVTPVPLSKNEARTMLAVHVDGQVERDDDIVAKYALGDAVAVIDGKHAGERGLLRKVKNNQLIVRLTGVGAASFDVPLEMAEVRHLTPAELGAMEQAEAMAAARADDENRAAAASGDADYSSGGDGGVEARRARRAERRAAAPGGTAETNDVGGGRAERSRWETAAAMADRERAGGAAAADAALDDDYASAPEADESVSDADAAFFDSLGGIIGDDQGSPPPPPPPPPQTAPGAVVDDLHDDDALLRALLGDDGDGGAAGNDASLDDFLGELADDSAFDAPAPPAPAAPRPGGDADEAELLAILGLAPDAPAGAAAAPDAAAAAGGAAAGDDYGARTVADLKDLLRDRGLKVSGKKTDLIERLVASDAM